MSEGPVTPRPAATILLLRHGATQTGASTAARLGAGLTAAASHDDRGVEVLMVRRTDSAAFMPGVWVFPGGVIEDGETPAQSAARELAEEAGVELSPEHELVAWSRWITPEVVPVRFDTHFFVALADPHTEPRADEIEVSDAAWFEPRAALEAHGRGELKLVFPTIKTLERMLDHETAEEVIEAARQRKVEPIEPRVVGTRDNHRVLMPWDDGYDAALDDPGKLPP